MERPLELLTDIRAMGVAVDLDDFGTGGLLAELLGQISRRRHQGHRACASLGQKAPAAATN